MRRKKRFGLFWSVGAGVLFFGLASCGQDPSFLNLEQGKNKAKKQSVDVGTENAVPIDMGNESGDDLGRGQGGVLASVIGDGPKVIDDVNPGGGDSSGGDDQSGGGDNGSGSGDGDTGGQTPTNPDDFVIPGANDDDSSALHKCLAKWQNLPFGQTITNYKKISASVSVGGFGNAINDTEQTEQPKLVLVVAGVNVGGQVTYNMLNKNGYYCIKVNVNVLTNLTVNLHCNARLADSVVGVNVGSVMNDNTAAIGVNVGSTVFVNTMRPDGQECIR